MTPKESQHNNLYRQLRPPNHTPPYPLPFLWRCLYIEYVLNKVPCSFTGKRRECVLHAKLYRKLYVSGTKVVRKWYAEAIQI